ncbi:MAG: hypothetical protein JXK05_03680 [Campylobacterales bacterium]|nr:hypothetical protein [Campylobacterales bacterium]
MRRLTVFSALSLTLLLGGCQNQSNPQAKHYPKVPCDVNRGFKEYYDVPVDYIALAHEAIDAMFKTIGTVPTKVLVTDFVDLTSLENFSQLGYVFSNSVKNALIHQYNINVIEAEVSKYFKISGNGLKILSRDVNTIRTQSFDVNRAVVGTYTYSDEEIIIFVKLIDLETGIIEGSFAKKLPMNCEMMHLLTRK